ncbi:putative effector protein/Carbonic anhydrase [Ceratobasidium theobromae]|uniref:Carbonic anhydrase n=1 Tax=Ceratobasidium theobromae TaxID=1582974 RepID=A0A5N5QDJ8_9AGAM|nr:putative effector protein/Carbonic anhydrase [Ceratobasidium theobromae]
MFFNIRVLAPLFLAASSLVNAHDGHEHSGVSLTARADGTKVAVVTCMDPRIEMDFILTQLGLKADTSYIVRNAGGRVKEALRSIIASQQFLGTSEVHVIHHTQCGMAGHSEGSMRKAFYSADDRSRAYMVNQMDFLPIRTTNFTESVLDDVALVQFHPLIKQGVKITGWVYNISSTGNDTMAQVYP